MPKRGNEGWNSGGQNPAIRLNGTRYAGKICGIIATVLTVLGVLIFGALFVLGFAAGVAGGGHH